MERAERIGLGTALAGHVALLVVLSLSLRSPPPALPPQHPIEISLAPDVSTAATSPTIAAPSASQAPDEGPPEPAAPPPEPAPQPAPRPAPEPQPAPAAPAKPIEHLARKPKPAPKPIERPAAKPVPAPRPVPKPVPKPRPAAREEAPARPTPARPAPAKSTPARTAPARNRAGADRQLADIVERAAAGAGREANAKAARPHGSRLGKDFLKGLSDTPSKAAPSNAAPAARIGAQQLADIGSAIQRQIQPCANKQVTPGPGAERIRVAVNLRLNRDGSLAAPPRIVSHDGVDEGNRRYLGRVDDLAVAAFTGCSPLHGLPAALYDVPNGWRSFTLRYKLPG